MGYKVAIDAGHGSNTAGKRTVDGYREHWINVKCAYYCEQYLKARGIDTVRIAWNDTNATDDIDVALSTRQKQVKNANCDVSISFHANACGDGKTWNSGNGCETLISNDKAKQKDSLRMAQCVNNQMKQGTKQTDRGVKTQALSLCNCIAMGTKASVLVEVGFMTNKYEAELMKTEEFCKEQGEQCAQGILDYLGVTNTSVTQQKPQIATKYEYKGKDYTLVFEPTYYADKNADLKNAFGYNVNKLLKHFYEYGMTEGRLSSPTFNVRTYKSLYADLQNAFGNNWAKYYEHYIQYGHKEGRKCI